MPNPNEGTSPTAQWLRFHAPNARLPSTHSPIHTLFTHWPYGHSPLSPSLSPPVPPALHPSTRLPIHLSNCPPAQPSRHPPTHLAILLSIQPNHPSFHSRTHWLTKDKAAPTSKSKPMKESRVATVQCKVLAERTGPKVSLPGLNPSSTTSSKLLQLSMPIFFFLICKSRVMTHAGKTDKNATWSAVLVSRPNGLELRHQIKERRCDLRQGLSVSKPQWG